MDSHNRPMGMDEDDSQNPFVMPNMRQSAQVPAPPPPRRSVRPNFGVPPQFYGDPVPPPSRIRQVPQQRQMVNVALSLTNPFLPEMMEMERTTASVPPEVKTIRRRETYAHSTATSVGERRRKELEIRNIQLQMEINEVKLKQLELQRRSSHLEMELLEDDMEEGEIVSNDEDDHQYQQQGRIEDIKRWMKSSDTHSIGMSTIDDCGEKHQYYVPTPKPRKSLASAKPHLPFPNVPSPDPPPPPVFTAQLPPALPVQLTQVDNGVQTLAAAIVQAVSSQNRVSERFIARQSGESKLPLFFGNPLEWPVFHQQYQRSTLDCGFTRAQNMQRLEKSLRGDARRAVQGLMIVPDNADKVMEKLEQRFGKPRYVVEALISTAKKVATPKSDSIVSLLDFSNAISNLVTTVEVLKVNEHLHNPQLMSELVDKLPVHLKLEWGKVICKKSQVSLLDLSAFVEEIAEAVSAVSTPKFKLKDEPKGKGGSAHEMLYASENPKENKNACSFCDEEHKSWKCPKFLALNNNQRWRLVKQNKACFSCLNQGHQSSKCTRKNPCGVDGCSKKHSRLLHSSSNNERQSIDDDHDDEEKRGSNQDDDGLEINTHASQPRQVKAVLLRIIPVKLYGPAGMIDTHALLDEGSSVSMISEQMANELGLEGKVDPLVLKWTDSQCQKDEKSRRVSFDISAQDGGKRYSLFDVRTLANLNLPVQSVNIKDAKRRWRHLSNCAQLMDVSAAKPQLLIGQDNIRLSVAREVVEGPANAPIATRTRLGWVLHGPTNRYRSQLNFNHSFVCHEEDEEVHQLVKESFKLDSIGIQDRSSKPRNKDDEKALALIEKRSQKVDGRWKTALLWKTEPVKFPNSYQTALRRFNYLERKMAKDPNFGKQYSDRIQYYLENGYARILNEEEANELNPKTWYLPHFGAVHPNKPGKVRIVFDAAAKVNGVSLNNMMMTGPDLLTSLPGVLIKFRQRRIAFTGDIGDMFHQIRIRPEDRMSQRFLWRDGNGELKVMQMEVMIFGASCSPFCSQFIKNKNAMEHAAEYPDAVQAIIHRHYVDDYLDSKDTVEEAAMIIGEVKYVHSQGGFDIRKWISNNEELTATIPTDDRAESIKNLADWSEIPVERVLGLHWDPVKDDFTFKINRDRIGESILSCETRPTKREILRLMMLIFDPLGFLGCFTVKARMLLQAVWKSKIGWDDELGTELFRIWKNWIKELPIIATVRIPRCYSFSASQADELQLHIFADASESAYAAVAYLRIMKDEETSVSLIMSKTRVAPLKPVSVPRLELQASLIAARLGMFVMKEMELKVNRVVHWTDSRTVLAWIRSEDKRFYQYVANRIGEIHELTEVSTWRWVPTKQNVADDATRNGKADLSSSSRWWSGPDFLMRAEEEWPVERTARIDDLELEIKPELVAVVLNESVDVIPHASKYSSYMKYLRITAWIMRAVWNFKSLIKAEMECQEKELTMAELDEAELLLCRKSQEESFPEELNLILSNKPLKKGNRLAYLSPFEDEFGVMRMSSRTGATLIHPIILDPNYPFTKLLIMRLHVFCGHQGRETVANELRQKFCILNLKTAVKRSWNECRICVVRRAMPRFPIMAPLPDFRTEKPARPFTITGMDYFGPMEVAVGRRHEKRYGVLFTCLNVRAVHLEVAHSLSTDSCIMAIRRFASLRGQPKVIFSDNGTNLRGADAELKRSLQDLDQEQMQAKLTTAGIEWRFIPPLSPHMGGTWERLVRSVKVAMKTALSSCRIPRDEVLQTIFAEAAAVVNSRPLTDVSIDPGDKEALTPFHFLIGTSSHQQPPGVFVKDDLFSKKQWRQTQIVADQFWKRWVKEYLPTLQRRAKWRNGNPEVKVGTIVLVTDPGQPRNSWPLGKVVNVFPGADGVVRVADVKTSNGTYRRPVVKLAVLEVNERSSSPVSELGGKHVAEKAKKK